MDEPIDAAVPPFLNALAVTIEIAATSLMIYSAWRALAGPMATRTLVMRGSKAAEGYCMRQAAIYANTADLFAKVYDNTRLVSVV